MLCTDTADFLPVATSLQSALMKVYGGGRTRGGTAFGDSTNA